MGTSTAYVGSNTRTMPLYVV